MRRPEPKCECDTLALPSALRLSKRQTVPPRPGPPNKISTAHNTHQLSVSRLKHGDTDQKLRQCKSIPPSLPMFRAAAAISATCRTTETYTVQDNGDGVGQRKRTDQNQVYRSLRQRAYPPLPFPSIFTSYVLATRWRRGLLCSLGAIAASLPNPSFVFAYDRRRRASSAHSHPTC